MNIEDICNAYLRHKLRTNKSRHAQLVLALSRSFGQLQPQKITPQVIAAWRAQRPSLQDSSARRELGALISTLRWGARHKMFPLSDLPTIDLPPGNHAKSIWMTLSQEEHFWKCAQVWDKGTRPQDVRVFVALALDTAARKSAILGLTWDRVDLDNDLIDYRDPLVRKTNKRRIPIPINSRLKPILVEAKKHATGRFVIPTRNIDKSFREFATSIGWPWVTPHVCRHTWACLAAQAGMPMFHIARMLGDTLKTVEDNYAHLAPTHLQQVANWRFAQQPPGATP